MTERNKLWNEVSGFTGAKEEQKTLVESPDGKRTIVAIHYPVSPGIEFERTWFCLQLNGTDALRIMLQTSMDGSEVKYMQLGVIDKYQKDWLKMYTWRTDKGGKVDYDPIGTGISEEYSSILVTEGVDQISANSDLPWKIDVDAAVDHWFGRISEMIKKPDELQTVDFSVASVIVPFEK